MSIEKVMLCDRCNALGPATVYGPVRRIRREARENGWKVRGKDRDLCPDCANPQPNPFAGPRWEEMKVQP